MQSRQTNRSCLIISKLHGFLRSFISLFNRNYQSNNTVFVRTRIGVIEKNASHFINEFKLKRVCFVLSVRMEFVPSQPFGAKCYEQRGSVSPFRCAFRTVCYHVLCCYHIGRKTRPQNEWDFVYSVTRTSRLSRLIVISINRAAYQHRLHDRRRSGDYRRQCSIRFHNSFVVSRILSTGPSLVVTGSLRYSFNSNKLRGSLIFFYLHLGATDSCLRKFV